MFELISGSIRSLVNNTQQPRCLLSVIDAAWACISIGFENQVKIHHLFLTFSFFQDQQISTGICWRIICSVDMASSIPLALSLLGSITGYPLSSGTQKVAPNPPPSIVPSAPVQPPWNPPAVPSAPVQTSGPVPSAPHNTNGTVGTSPPTSNSPANTLCDVSDHPSIHDARNYEPHFHDLGLPTASKTLRWNQDTSLL